jgi:hypothetical protein
LGAPLTAGAEHPAGSCRRELGSAFIMASEVTCWRMAGLDCGG